MTDPLTEAERIANELYVRVVQPDTIWWDDLTPEMQAGWLRAASWVAAERERMKGLVKAAWRVVEIGNVRPLVAQRDLAIEDLRKALEAHDD